MARQGKGTTFLTVYFVIIRAMFQNLLTQKDSLEYVDILLQKTSLNCFCWLDYRYFRQCFLT